MSHLPKCRVRVPWMRLIYAESIDVNAIRGVCKKLFKFKIQQTTLFFKFCDRKYQLSAKKVEKLALACIEPGDFLESISEWKFQFLGNFENICEILFSESNVWNSQISKKFKSWIIQRDDFRLGYPWKITSGLTNLK